MPSEGKPLLDRPSEIRLPERALPPKVKPRGSLRALIASALSLTSLIALGLWAGAAAFEVLPGLDIPHSPLRDVIGAPAAGSRRLSRHVVVVIVDGLSDNQAFKMRTLTRLGVGGARTIARAYYPSYTRPMLATILSGVEPRYSGLRTNKSDDQLLEVDSLPMRARAVGLRTAVVANLTSWLAELAPQAWTDARFLPIVPDWDRWAAATFDAGYDLTFVHYDSVDIQGHAFGAASPEYAAAEEDVDRSLEKIVGRLDLAQDTIVITADHGHRARGGHGGTEEAVLNVPFVMAGAGVRTGGPAVSFIRHTDIAPTLAALLGISAPLQAHGHVVSEMLTLSPAEAAVLARADAVRLLRVEAAISSFESSAERTRIWHTLARSSLALVAFFGFFVLSRLLARRGWLIWDKSVLWVGAPVYTAAFYGIFLIFEGSFSLSVFREFWPVVNRLFRYGAAAAVLHTVIAWFVLMGRRAPRDRLAATAGLTLAGLALAVFPALVAYAVVGGGPQVVPPPEGWTFFAMLAYAGLACYCAAAGAVLLLELAVFVARSSYRPA